MYQVKMKSIIFTIFFSTKYKAISFVLKFEKSQKEIINKHIDKLASF